MTDLLVKLTNLLYEKGVLSIKEFEDLAKMITIKDKEMEKIQKDLKDLDDAFYSPKEAFAHHLQSGGQKQSRGLECMITYTLC